MYYRLAISLAILLAPVTLHALSLTEALNIARNEAITLQALSAETRQAEAVHQQSSKAYLPSVSADASWLRADSSLITGVPVPSLGIPPTIQRTDFGPVEGTLTGVQVVQPLFNADAIKLRQAASLKLDARRYAEQWGHQAIRLEVSRLYFNVLRQREQLEALLVSHQAARQAATLAQASYREGLASRLDTEQADAELAAIEARIAHARAKRLQTQVELETFLGISPGQAPDLSTPLPQPSPPVRIGDARARKDLQAQQIAAEAASADTSAFR